LAGVPSTVKGETACAPVGEFVNKNDIFMVNSEWTTFTCYASRYFNEPAGAIVELKIGDTISFKSGFKMFLSATAESATV